MSIFINLFLDVKEDCVINYLPVLPWIFVQTKDKQ